MIIDDGLISLVTSLWHETSTDVLMALQRDSDIDAAYKGRDVECSSLKLLKCSFVSVGRYKTIEDSSSLYGYRLFQP